MLLGVLSCSLNLVIVHVIIREEDAKWREERSKIHRVRTFPAFGFQEKEKKI